MNKLKLLYFIIVVELFMLGIVVIAEKKSLESKNNNLVKENMIQDKRDNKREYNEGDKATNLENNHLNDDKAFSESKDKIMSRDELRKSIEKKFADNQDKMSSEEIEEILKDEAISVFKVECSTIKGSLDFQDIKNILSVARKVDKNMFNTIQELLYHDNQEYGVLKSLLLLRENLDEKDYEKVSETASKYVDMSKVEQYYYLEKSGASLQGINIMNIGNFLDGLDKKKKHIGYYNKVIQRFCELEENNLKIWRNISLK